MKPTLYLVAFSMLIACGPPTKISLEEVSVARSLVGDQWIMIYNYKEKPYTGLIYRESSGPNGDFVASEKNTKEGVLHGTAKEWYSEGILREEKMYQEGSLASLKKWSVNKKPTVDITYDTMHSKQNEMMGIDGWAILNSKEWDTDGNLTEELKQLSPPEFGLTNEGFTRIQVHSYKLHSKQWYPSGAVKSENQFLTYYIEIRKSVTSTTSSREGTRDLDYKAYREDGSLSKEVKAIVPEEDMSKGPQSFQDFAAKTGDSLGIPSCGTRREFADNKTVTYEGFICGEDVRGTGFFRQYLDDKNDYLSEKFFNQEGVLTAESIKECPECPLVVNYFWEDGKPKAELSRMEAVEDGDTEKYSQTNYSKYWGENGLHFHRYLVLNEESKRLETEVSCWNVEGYPRDVELHGLGCHMRLEELVKHLIPKPY